VSIIINKGRKMMKKGLSVVLSVVLVLSLFLVGCGNKLKLEGTTWKLTSGKDESGVEITEEALDAAGMGEFTFKFKSDKVTVDAYGETSEGKYSVSGDEVTIDFDGEKATAKIDGSKMTMDQDGTTLIFEKQ
jgi:hypothetical protein